MSAIDIEAVVGAVARQFVAQDRHHCNEVADLQGQLEIQRERAIRRLRQWDRLTLDLHEMAERKEKLTPKKVQALIRQADA